MKILVTKSEHKLPLPLLRVPVKTKAYLIVDKLEFTKRGVSVNGYYYCYYDGGKHKLSEINNKVILWEQLTALESQLQGLKSESLLGIISQRIEELMMVTLQMEGLENYEIPPSDWGVLKED